MVADLARRNHSGLDWPFPVGVCGAVWITGPGPGMAAPLTITGEGTVRMVGVGGFALGVPGCFYGEMLTRRRGS